MMLVSNRMFVVYDLVLSGLFSINRDLSLVNISSNSKKITITMKYSNNIEDGLNFLHIFHINQL